jgi:hypothetical protein
LGCVFYGIFLCTTFYIFSYFNNHHNTVFFLSSIYCTPNHICHFLPQNVFFQLNFLEVYFYFLIYSLSFLFSLFFFPSICTMLLKHRLIFSRCYFTSSSLKHSSD